MELKLQSLIYCVALCVSISTVQAESQSWTPATVYNHESSMLLDADGALAFPHPRTNPSTILTGTDGGKDSDANLPFPIGIPIPDSYGQAVKATNSYLFVSALTETNENSLLGGGVIYIYQRQGREWIFTQKLDGSEAGEPWQFESFSPFKVAVPGFFYVGADEDDLLVGVFNHLDYLRDGVFAYRLMDLTDDGLDNPIWVFSQKLTRPTPADYPPDFFGTRVAMDGKWALIVSNHEDHDVGVDSPFDLSSPSGLTFIPGPGQNEMTGLASAVSLDLSFGPDLGLGDDDSTEVAFPAGFPFLDTTHYSLWVNSDGTVSFGAPSIDFFRTATSLIRGAPRIAALLTDLDPSSGGAVHADVRFDRVVVTWNSVPNYSVSNANTVQMVLHSDGVIDLVYEQVEAALATVGFAEGLQGGAAHDIDLSADLPFTAEAGAIFEEFSPRRVNNAGVVWAYQQDEDGLWQYMQRITQPDRITRNGQFGGSGLALQGTHAVIGGAWNGYVFELLNPDDPGSEWNWTGQILSVFDSPTRGVLNADVSIGTPAIDNGHLIMGAPRAGDFSDTDGPIAQTGAAMMYGWDASTDQWVFRQELLPSDPQAGATFGFSTDISGRLAIIGANQYDVDLDGDAVPDVADAGVAYLFARNGQTWTELIRLEHPSPQQGDAFSGGLGCVSLVENYAVVGTFVNSALFNSSPGLFNEQAGSAVVFDRRPN